MRQARQWNDNAIACRLGAAVALAAGSLIPVAPAGAQTAACATAACTSAQQSQLSSLLSPFTTLAGTNALSASFQTEGRIYQNATYAQQVQAAPNATLANVLTLIWLPANNPSSLDANVQSALANSTVMSAVNNAYNIPHTAAQPTFLKGNPNFTTYQSFGQTGPWNLPNIDPHPFQTNQVVWGNQWTNATVPCPSGTAAADCPAAVQASNWQSDLTNTTSGSFPSAHMIGGSTAALTYAVMMPEAYQDLMWSAQQFGLSRNIIGVHYPTDIIGGRIAAYYTMAQVLANNPLFVTGNYQAVLASTAATLRGAIAGGVPTPYAGCAGSNVAACIANGTFPTAAQFTAANQSYVALTNYELPATGSTNLAPVVPDNAELLIASRFPYLSASQRRDVLASTELPSGAPLDNGSGWARLNLFAAAGGYGAFTSNVTVTMDAALGGFHAIDMWSNNISGPGGLTKLGTGTLVLGGNNTFTGGTVVGGGTLALSGTMIGDLSTLPGATFVTGGGYAVSATSTLNNAGTFQSVNASLSNQGTLINSGTMLSSLATSGAVSNTGSITGTISNSGSFANNGVVNGAFTNTGLLSGSGTIVGTVANLAALSPGNSIGTLTVSGSLTQAASGTYQVETNSAGQGDRINVTGTPGTASLNGAVSVVGASGVQAPRTTYTILNATGGIAGTFASANSLYPFLLPQLSYDANNVYLTLQIGGFAAAGQTATQQAVGLVLDANVFTATGDFATVIGSMAANTQSAALAQATLTSLSGQNYSSASTAMVLGAQLFMNNFSNQTGGGSPVAVRVALAEACDIACDVAPPAAWGAWGGALGGLGVVGSGTNPGQVTYNVGGFAAGLDRMVAPGLSVGATAGYTTGTQWTQGFSGQGTTDTFLVGLYGNYRMDKLYADAVFGYGYSYNRISRQIFIPGLQPRTAQGNAGANQWYGQIEGGYRVDIGTTAEAYITPFARLQGYTGALAGFTETGAQSLNLTVAGQTTNSLRSVIGAQFGGAIDLGWREKLALQVRLGWSHEYADTARPVTATLAGAPLMPFTTYGVAPTRDGALVGFSANTAVAGGTSVYLRYEGNVSGQDSAHALTAGVRMSW